MELRELRTFCTAAKLRSISKAADNLNIGQPTATTHIKKLETELNAKLFDRMKRPIQLTLAGATLSQLATPLVEGIDALASQTAMAEEEGPVAIAATHDIIPHTLLRVVSEFRTRFPHVHLRMRSALRNEVLALVEEGEVDMGFLARPVYSATLEFRGLFPYERVLIAPQGHPLLREPVTSLEQIGRYPLILRGRQSHTRALLEHAFRRRNIQYDVIVELENFDMIKRYVAMNVGISVGPRLAIDPDDERVIGVASLAALLPVDQGGVVTLQGKTLSTPAENFMDLAQSVIGRQQE